MTEDKEIREGNRLIAKFEKSTAIHSPHLLLDEYIKYHSSWSWLMSVVEKIASTPSISITIESFTVENGDRPVGLCEIKRTFWMGSGIVNTEQIVYKKEFLEKCYSKNDLELLRPLWAIVFEGIEEELGRLKPEGPLEAGGPAADPAARRAGPDADVLPLPRRGAPSASFNAPRRGIHRPSGTQWTGLTRP